MEPKLKPFYRDLTNLVLSGVAVLTVIGMFATYFIKYNLMESDYIKITDISEYNVSELDEIILNKENYVKLFDYCVDDEVFIWQETKDGRVTNEWTYYLLNNQCDSIEGPLVIVEMDKRMNKKLNEAISDEEIADLFTGRFYKGYRDCEAPFYSLKQTVKVDGNNLYTLKAGETPNKVRKDAWAEIYIIWAFCVFGIISLIVAIISYNVKRKKDFRRKMEKYLSELANNDPKKLF